MAKADKASFSPAGHSDAASAAKADVLWAPAGDVDPRSTPDRLQTDPGWMPLRHRVDLGATPDRSEISPERPRIGSGSTPDRPRMDSGSTPGRPSIDPRFTQIPGQTPDRAQINPDLTEYRPEDQSHGPHAFSRALLREVWSRAAQL